MYNYFKSLLILQLAVLFLCCSDPKTEYDTIQKIQDECEQLIERTTDYDLKIKACDDAINSLQGFLKKHNEGEWSSIAQTALSTWQINKASITQKFNSLTEMLYKKLNDRAVEEATKLHPGSEIEKIQLSDIKSRKEPDKVICDATYSVKMRGRLLGIHVFNFVVNVSGHIATDSNDTFVDKASIEE